jgi:hypothetical protein
MCLHSFPKGRLDGKDLEFRLGRDGELGPWKCGSWWDNQITTLEVPISTLKFAIVSEK